MRCRENAAKLLKRVADCDRLTVQLRDECRELLRLQMSVAEKATSVAPDATNCSKCAELQAFIDAAFVAHPNLDLDIEAANKRLPASTTGTWRERFECWGKSECPDPEECKRANGCRKRLAVCHSHQWEPREATTVRGPHYVCACGAITNSLVTITEGKP